MRCLYMLKEKPDAEKLRGFIARCRQPDGSYSVAPGGPGNLGATYFATIILRWLRLLDGKPPGPRAGRLHPALQRQGPRRAGRGTRRSGRPATACSWASRPGLDHNEFLATRQSYGDFILSLRFRLVDGKGNSGVQFRSVRVPGTEMSGYQADIGENYWGCLYDESRRNKVLVKASPEALEALKKDGWNHYVLCATGDRITLYLNGVPSVVYREEDPGIARDGQIAVQIHAGAPMEVQFKDLQIRVLP